MPTASPTSAAAVRRRAREFGLVFGEAPPGEWNAVTDVADLAVGHTTVWDEAAGVYSGATAITHPHLAAGTPLPAALFVGNGYGKLVGATQLMELGQVETPIVLTSTLSAFRAADALVTWILQRRSDPPRSLNPLVAEINDSWLAGAPVRAVTEQHVHDALATARSGPVPAGSVGGGAGACALGFKAGIGTASRRVEIGGSTSTLGVLVQANMTGDLRLSGRVVRPEDLGLTRAGARPEDGSCVVLTALDRPCTTNTLRRLATRSVFALGRVGAAYGHGSGDYGITLSTCPGLPPRELRPDDLDQLIRATMDGVEEAVVDALAAARTVRTPNGLVAHELPTSALATA